MIPQRIIHDRKMLALLQLVQDNWTSVVEMYRGVGEFSAISEDDLVMTAILVPESAPLLLTADDGTRDLARLDAENSVLVYQYLGSLSPVQAADARLWVTLAHTTFLNYVRSRWGTEDSDKLKTAVLRHWFPQRGKGKAALRNQGISRLWWAAHLTRAPWDRDRDLAVFRTADQFYFTRILFRQQQIYMDLVERDFGSDLRIRICVLDSLSRHLPNVVNKDMLSREASKRLNLLLKHRQLSCLPITELRRACDEIVAGAAKEALARGSKRPASETGEVT